MPKASKRQKEKKADFQKTKLKLGKGKQAANNATDVSFKAKTIALPQQSINVDKSGKLVNSRNLTIADLALQLRHYSAGVRRDAVSGIKEILSLHPSLIITDAASLIPELARCIGDEDAAVRKQLHALLSWVLPQIPAQLLGPYHGTLLLFTTSALSHIYPEVRLGAVKILDVCLSILPQVATSGWENAVHKMASAVSSAQNGAGSSDAAGPSKASHQPHGERIMNCYLNLLGITHRSSAAASITSIDLAPGAKLLILQSLRTFLSHALPSTLGDNEDAGNEQSCPTWFFRSAFASSAEFEYFQRILGRHLRSSRSRSVSVKQSERHKSQKPSPSQHGLHASYTDWPAADWASSSLMDLDSTSGNSLNQTDLFSSLQAATTLQSPLSTDARTVESEKPAKSAALSLYALLDPVLLASFLDTAPSAFQPDLDLSQQLRGQNVGLSTPAQLVFEIVSLMLALWRGASSPSTKARTSLANTLGHISVYFPFSHHTGASGLSAKAKSAVVQMNLTYAELAALVALNEAGSRKIKSKFNVEVQIASVSSFIAELLSTPVTESGTVSLASTGTDAGVLDPDTFRALLPTLWFLLGTEHESLLDSLLATYHSQASTHKVKAVLFEFLARAFLLSKVRAMSPFTASESERIVESLLSTFPRTLWEAANSNSGQAFAGVQLEFLHFLLLLPSPPAKMAYEKFGPLYWIRHPTKNVSVPGPWNKLPPSLRKLALDNITLLQGRDAKLDKALSQALEFAEARS